ncbi:MAG: hypothetical protein JO345_21690 [Streptosporangiaceae bacterium]|nr:hypothetical protein [Streptosporangiaceae bacterium]
MAAGSWLVLFVAGVGVSLAASWLLVSRLERLAERAGFSEAWLGLVAALAADAPEITSAVTALTRGRASVGPPAPASLNAGSRRRPLLSQSSHRPFVISPCHRARSLSATK